MARKLGPYDIHSELGRGAMAIVWRAHDPVLDREVAVKEPMLPQGVDAVSATEFGARFVREGRAAAKLSHPNIVTIHAADIYDGRAALVMELVEGATLGEMLSRGPLGPQAALSVLEQLLSAVGYAHERGIVHRDIKPDNVFLTHDGRVKLADFGIASLGGDSTLTQAGTIMGTPGYMAPEQITGDPVDARADIFAIGVLAYEMLTGKNPFGASDGLPITTVMYRIVHQAPPELPPEALAGFPEQLHSVLEVALAKDPGYRFPSAGSFLAALKGEGPLPTPVAAGVSAGGRSGGTILTRLSAIKSAAMISRTPGKGREPSWKRSWVPYTAVVGVGLVVMIALLVAARNNEAAATMVVSADTSTSNPASIGTTSTSTTLAGWICTPFGGVITLPAGWETKGPVAMGTYTHYEAVSPEGMKIVFDTDVKSGSDPWRRAQNQNRIYSNDPTGHPGYQTVYLGRESYCGYEGARLEFTTTKNHVLDYHFVVPGQPHAACAAIYPRTWGESARQSALSILSTFRVP